MLYFLNESECVEHNLLSYRREHGAGGKADGVFALVVQILFLF